MGKTPPSALSMFDMLMPLYRYVLPTLSIWDDSYYPDRQNRSSRNRGWEHLVDETIAVRDEVRRVARALLPRALHISAQVTERVLQVVPELAPAGATDAVRAVRESTDQNIGAMVSTLAFGITPSSIEPPSGTQDLLRNLIAGGGNVTHLLRAYRVGHELLWRIWSEHARTATDPAVDIHAVLRVSSAHLFDYIDRACQRIVEEHPAPLGSAGAGLATSTGLTSRPETVRRLLGSDPVDLAGATATLGYDLGRHHVALMVAPLLGPADVRRELERLVEVAGVPALAVPSGEGTWWGWLGWTAAPSDTELARLAATPVTGVLVGMGEPDRGRDGFRRSQAQAREAERAARLAERPAPTVVRHRDVEIAALLCGDPERARLLAAQRLGPLADRDETGARLRATLRALLAHGHNRGHTAAALNVHHKTVSYRIAQAEELLGRTLSSDTFDLETALLIDRTLYGP
jgi:PucR C-terminal helix-turn-helix domain/GGDEF-like domain